MSRSPEHKAFANTWLIRVPTDRKDVLNRKFLGLTFMERRLREAKKAGIDHVYFVVPKTLAAEPPPHTNRKRCAPWSLVESEPVAPGSQAYEVELFAIIEPQAPFNTLLLLDPNASWDAAMVWFRKHIIETSGATWFAKQINKPISLFLSTRLANTPITPNQWSVFNLAVGLGSGWYVSRPDYLSVLIGGLLFQTASVFDGVDGEIAKFRLESSRFGAWLDTFVDNISLLAFLTGCGVHLFRYSAIENSTALALIAVTLISLVTYLFCQMDFIRKHFQDASLAVYEKKFLRHLPRTDPFVRISLSLAPIFKKDLFSFLFFAMCALGQLHHLLHFVATGMVLALCIVLYLNSRYGRYVDEKGIQTNYL